MNQHEVRAHLAYYLSKPNLTFLDVHKILCILTVRKEQISVLTQEPINFGLCSKLEKALATLFLSDVQEPEHSLAFKQARLVVDGIRLRTLGYKELE